MLAGGLAAAEPTIAAVTSITLSRYCPPGFEQQQNSRCYLRSQYEAYSSLQAKGIGGLQTGLPPLRDGFTAQQIDLGRYLFFDPYLSRNNRLACASCHDPDNGFGDGLKLSRGRDGRALARNAPTLWNSGFLEAFNWDGGAFSLEDQLAGPLYHPNELGQTPELLIAKLNRSAAYQWLFQDSFLSETGNAEFIITEAMLRTALTAFQSSLISLNSRYDQYVHGYHEALTASEIKGLNVFRSFVARCAECHTPPLFTNQQIAVIGVGDAGLDPGARSWSKEAKLEAGFKVPTLRNIAKSGPYMHHGRFSKLESVLEFYNQGRGHEQGDRQLHLHWHLTSPGLRSDELIALKSFLESLTDESFKPRRPQQLPSGLTLTPTTQLGSNP